jgi:hypothetical protein
MRSAGNFSPEWGYLAPAPSLARTARVVLVATAIGATAGAGVVLSLVERPAEAQKSPIAARAIVTSVRETAVPSVAPTVSIAAVTSPVIAPTGASVSAPTPVAASTPPPALKLGASARTAARAMPQAQRQASNPPLAAPPSTVATATSPLVLPASVTPGSATQGSATPGSAASVPSASATSLSASDSGPATAGTTAGANAGVAAVSSSAATVAIGSTEAPKAADAAPTDVTENPSIIGPESPPPKKAKRHASSKNAPAPGLGSILRRLFVAHSGRSYYPHSANGGL